jgi:hypothetical protein
VEQVEAVTYRQQHSKHISETTDTDIITVGVEFSMQSAPRLYNVGQMQQSAEFHNSQSHETVKHGSKSHRTQNQEQLCWQGPAEIYVTNQQVTHELLLSSGSSWLARRNPQC